MSMMIIGKIDVIVKIDVIEKIDVNDDHWKPEWEHFKVYINDAPLYIFLVFTVENFPLKGDSWIKTPYFSWWCRGVMLSFAPLK